MDEEIKLKRSFNLYKNEYRFQRANQDSNNWSRFYIDNKSEKYLRQTNYRSGFDFRPYPYKFYSLRYMGWGLLKYVNRLKRKRLFRNKTFWKLTAELIIAISAAIIGYWILKFKLGWI